MLFEVKERQLATVSTDGHRLALAPYGDKRGDDSVALAAILQKSRTWLQRLLAGLEAHIPNQDNEITLNVGREFLQESRAFWGKSIIQVSWLHHGGFYRPI